MRKIIIGVGAVAVLAAGCNLEQDPVAVQSADPGKSAGKSSRAVKAETFPIKQIATTTLAPHEKATGFVCAKGAFRPKVIAMTNLLFAEAARARVAA